MVSPIILTLELSKPPLQEANWCLIETILHDTEAFKQIEIRLKDYFKINDATVDSLSTLWEAH